MCVVMCRGPIQVVVGALRTVESLSEVALVVCALRVTGLVCLQTDFPEVALSQHHHCLACGMCL
jgi:hypothetical protein